MADNLEQRVAALESQSAGGPADTAMVQAFLQGALAAYAASQQQGAAGGQGLAAGAPAGGGQGLFGWNPTRYDSIFWCKSRFMCNPQSVSCLC
jgi:hypothetical protein